MWVHQSTVWVGMQYGDADRSYTVARVVFLDEGQASKWGQEVPETRVTFEAVLVKGDTAP